MTSRSQSHVLGCVLAGPVHEGECVVPDIETPRREQLRRTAGWRLPEGAVNVARPTMHGNPYRVTKPDDRRHPPFTVLLERNRRQIIGSWGGFTDERDATVFAVELFRRDVLYVLATDEHAHRFLLDPLRGRDLYCWCKPGDPCHADVWIDLANRKDVPA